ncbi:DUF3050 domain-containing protein [Pleionea sediminis]|uniref:DUF3050 domain-containing protein n=1 Tax=Pleionea sediminis TaxID=2569479 RepID=UPI0011851B28|nr:DUF3050 domain-containing protein [Pleionea sediminis]
MLTFDDPHLKSLCELLTEHPLLKSIQSHEDLEIFTSQYVFVEWSTMTLVKALQANFTNHEILWSPTDDPMGRKLVNDLVIHFESNPDVGGLSRLEWYMQVMHDNSVDTAYMECMLDNIQQYGNYASIIDSLDFAAQRYVHNIVQTAMSGRIVDIAAAFFLGVWVVEPLFAKQLLFGINSHVLNRANSLRYFLEVQSRPIHEEQKVTAINLLSRLCNNDSQNFARCIHVAAKLLELKHMLWDSIYYQIIEKSSKKKYLQG